MSILNNSLLLGTAADAGGYQISRSLRFNSADSAYLSRTPASAGNRKTWTWSGWVKRATIGSSYEILFSARAGTSGNRDYLTFQSDQLVLTCVNSSGTTTANIQTTALFRDPAAWYHLVLAVDTTQATAANRVRMYVNGTEITVFSLASYPSQNTDLSYNDAQPHTIGQSATGTAFSFSGYLANVEFVDGAALTPASFAETNATTGQWVPKAYTGSYGTNGFRLDFSDNSAATATTLGKDRAGSNNWTPNNISVTAGAGNDSLVDTPSSAGTDTGLGGQVTGNYATLNPLFNSYPNLSNGNLDSGPWSDNGWNRNVSSIVVNTGKWYFEANIGNATDGSFRNGIGIQINPVSTSASKYLGDSSDSYGGLAKSAGITGYTNAGAGTSLSNALSSGSILRCAVDVDAGKVWIGDSTAYIGGGSPASGTSPTYTFTANSNVALGVSTWGGGDVTSVNYGQRAFSATAPSGFKALCDTNLPAPTIARPSTVFDTRLYTSNAGTLNVSGLGFSPDFAWLKSRGTAVAHALYDTVRGAGRALKSNTTEAEQFTTDGFVSFNSDGFTLGANTSSPQPDINFTNNVARVAWCWDAGSSTVTNTAGSISSQVRANASAGFSIVTFTVGSGSGSFTVGHGLGVTPGLIIWKPRVTVDGWYVWHSSFAANEYARLDQTGAKATSVSLWNNTAPTSSVMSGSYGSWGSYGNMVAYCFAPVAGYSAFGSYTGNGSADGPFVYLGFRPAVVLVKMSSSTGDWTILDDKREGYNVDNDPLYPNLSNAEGTTDLIDITSNGFKVRTTDATFNTSAGTYVYAAWASSPFAYSRAR